MASILDLNRFQAQPKWEMLVEMISLHLQVARNSHRLPPLVLLLFASLPGGCSTGPSVEPPSKIKSDERVVFFPTAARLTDDGRSWIVPIHGWIFEPEEDDLLRNAGLDQFCDALGLERKQAGGAMFEKRARLFLVDNERGKRTGILVGNQTYTLDASQPDGHFTGAITISTESVNQLATEGRLAFRAVTRPDDRREFHGVVQLVRPTGMSVISDIDDTIKVTEVRDKKKLINNTFFQPFRAVDGMAATYREWADSGAQFHFVSSSPWQLYEPLSQFMRDAGFPEATFHLKRFRIKDRSFLKLFADPLKTKEQVIAPILETYPKRHFVLVGDSGEKDPEVYGVMARKYSQQIQRVYIRDVTGESADATRYRDAFKDVPAEKWRVFDDPQTLTLPQR